MNKTTIGILFGLLALGNALAQEVGWPSHGNDPGGSKYSSLDGINRRNVAELELAWTWATGEQPIPTARLPIAGQPIAPGKFQGTALMVRGLLFIATSYNQVVALDPDSGEEIWRYDPKAWEWGRPLRGCGFCHRGVAVWTNGDEIRVFINSRWRLIALDGHSGQPIASFGYRGEVDLTEDLAWEVNRLHYSNTSPPMIFGNLVIVGSGVPDDRIYRQAPPGDIQAFDVITGKRAWVFHTTPQEGEFGTDTWGGDSWTYTGANNVWAPFTIDAERGLAYFPVSTPNNDFYGGHRVGDNLFAETLLCLDARTGKRVWHFQTVHHGVWDYDLPAPPNLLTINVDGRRIDAVAAVGKTGFTYVFDRVTGEPVWPIEERPVPQSDIPGEQTSPTQPYPTKPPPFGRQSFSEDDLLDFTPELRARALEATRNYSLGDMFSPPTLHGTAIMPGIWGAANWGGAAVDPETGTLYVKALNWPSVFHVEKPPPGTEDADYFLGDFRPLNIEGLPVHKPPYSTLTAIDLNRGEHAWQVPFGDYPEMRAHPLLQGIELPAMLGAGPPQHGQSGPLLTAGGVLFLSSATRNLYAIDKDDGSVLATFPLDGYGYGNPVTYRTKSGRQFVVIASSEKDGSNAKLNAFALPE
ncbi:MAG: pyrroloquinoline quinone-dependent dehydrogenase [Gammaproteobacteria bacterium]|nr:pyrroloquinoline quinone-dependent dehydrogenase [Gammaproteobacteria bacterium]